MYGLVLNSMHKVNLTIQIHTDSIAIICKTGRKSCETIEAHSYVK
jgi:hypothetical protein